MPQKRYVTVTLKKEVINRLSRLSPQKPKSALVSEAILEYINNKKYKLDYFNTHSMCVFEMDGTNLTTKLSQSILGLHQ